jgi:hypothetical protein
MRLRLKRDTYSILYNIPKEVGVLYTHIEIWKVEAHIDVSLGPSLPLETAPKWTVRHPKQIGRS